MAAVAPLKLLPAREAALAPLLKLLRPRLNTGEQAELYALLGSLDAQGLFPAQGPYALIAEAWLALAQVLPAARNAELLPLLRALTNALCHLLAQSGAQPRAWLQDWLAGVSLWPDTPQWLVWGQVLAWRWGLASLRREALHNAEAWPEDLQRLALAGFCAAELRANPWLPGQAGLCCQRVLGGLRSWGGQLLSPPRVVWEGDILWVADSLQVWRVQLDAWGVQWQRAENFPSPAPAPPVWEESAQLALPADAVIAAQTHTLAVTRPLSLQIWIFGHGAQRHENVILGDNNFNA